VFDLAGKWPSTRLHPGVRVISNHHAINLLGWAEVIQKNPGADSAKSRLRE
jgi:hypothetical protein